MINLYISKISEFVEKVGSIYFPQYFEWLNKKVAEAGDFNVLSLFIGFFPLVILMLYLLFGNRY